MKLRVLLFLSALILTGCATTTLPGAVGVNREQFLLVPASEVNQMAEAAYTEEYNKAKSAGRLIVSGNEYDRLKRIEARLVQQSAAFRNDSTRWNWQLMLVDDPKTINAGCLPGGKIIFYTGIIQQLKLTDAEIAAVMGHEIAHALREHGRERMSRAMAQGLAVTAATGGRSNQLADQIMQITFTLPSSREAESEADRIGLELMARAGYNPQAAISVWQKMMGAKHGNPPEFLSTHPAPSTRISELTNLQFVVAPLYQAAAKP